MKKYYCDICEAPIDLNKNNLINGIGEFNINMNKYTDHSLTIELKLGNYRENHDICSDCLVGIIK